MDDTAGFRLNRNDWPDVKPPERVAVSLDGYVLYEGFVDERTEDGTVIWVQSGDGYRRLLHLTDGIHLSKLETEGKLATAHVPPARPQTNSPLDG